MLYILLALFLSVVPYFFWKKLDLPYILYIIFIFGTLILGDVFLFYEKVPFWDSIMHFFSGFIISLFAFKILNNKVHKIYKCIFCISIALSFGAIWEIGEFISDSLFNNNAMRTLGKTGLSAVSDTIKDLVLDLLGSTLILFKKR